MSTRLLLIALIALLATGCASEAIKLHHPSTGAGVTCGPYAYWPSIIRFEIRLRDCGKDYQQGGGYNRTP